LKKLIMSDEMSRSLKVALIREVKRSRCDAHAWRNVLRAKTRDYDKLQESSDRAIAEREGGAYAEQLEELREMYESKCEEAVRLEQEVNALKQELACARDDKDCSVPPKHSSPCPSTASPPPCRDDPELREKYNLALMKYNALKKRHKEDSHEIKKLRRELNRWLRKYKELQEKLGSAVQSDCSSSDKREKTPIGCLDPDPVTILPVPCPKPPLDRGPSLDTPYHASTLRKDMEHWKEEAFSWKLEAQRLVNAQKQGYSVSREQLQKLENMMRGYKKKCAQQDNFIRNRNRDIADAKKIAMRAMALYEEMLTPDDLKEEDPQTRYWRRRYEELKSTREGEGPRQSAKT